MTHQHLPEGKWFLPLLHTGIGMIIHNGGIAFGGGPGFMLEIFAVPVQKRGVCPHGTGIMPCPCQIGLPGIAQRSRASQRVAFERK